MLAGIVIGVVVVAGLAIGLPWLSARYETAPDAIDEDLTDRFSGSLRILPREVDAYSEEAGTDVSTPLTRRAQLSEIRLLARNAAARRRRSLLLIAALAVVLGALVAFGPVPEWTLLVPAALLLTFMVVARVGVTAMRSRLDARVAATEEGWGDEEDTTVIAAPTADELSTEFAIDLTPPIVTGALWDPVQVITPTYMSKPLVPRTVRTIDLSAPVVSGLTMIPTADPIAAPAPDPVQSRAVGE